MSLSIIHPSKPMPTLYGNGHLLHNVYVASSPLQAYLSICSSLNGLYSSPINIALLVGYNFIHIVIAM